MTEDGKGDYKSFRLASLNILHNPRRVKDRINMVIDELHELDPDALCLQEIMNQTDVNTVGTILRALNWKGSVTSSYGKPNGDKSGTAVLSKHPIEASRVIDRTTSNHNETPSAAASINYNGERIEVISAHLIWGAENESVRLSHARAIDRHARRVRDKHKQSIVLLGGDFNSLPEADTSRFFSGLSSFDGHSTYWTDAWNIAGKPENAVTIRKDNDFAIETAASMGVLFPNFMPNRRIDFIKSFGWNYGKVGSPVSFGQWANTTAPDGLTISDHYGIYSDILLG